MGVRRVLWARRRSVVLRGPPVCHPLALRRVLACADHWNACALGRGPVARDPGFQPCAGRFPQRISGKAAPDVAPDRYRHWEYGEPRFFVPWEAFASVPAWFFETRPPSCVHLLAWSLALARRHATRGVRLKSFRSPRPASKRRPLRLSGGLRLSWRLADTSRST